MVKKLDITGIRFGRLVAMQQNGFAQSPSRKHIRWDYQCDCGSIYNARINSVLHGRTVSCGCQKKEGNSNRKHGMSRSSEYESWAGMRGRCNNPNDQDFYLYGGRGIKVCERWSSFEKFFLDMGKKKKGESIDRIDVNGDYSPDNCRWADNRTQSRNKRNNRNISFNGETKCLQDWANSLGICSSTLIGRLKKWPIDRALTKTKENQN